MLYSKAPIPNIISNVRHTWLYAERKFNYISDSDVSDSNKYKQCCGGAYVGIWRRSFEVRRSVVCWCVWRDLAWPQSPSRCFHISAYLYFIKKCYKRNTFNTNFIYGNAINCMTIFTKELILIKFHGPYYANLYFILPILMIWRFTTSQTGVFATGMYLRTEKYPIFETLCYFKNTRRRTKSRTQL